VTQTLIAKILDDARVALEEIDATVTVISCDEYRRLKLAARKPTKKERSPNRETQEMMF
jgi:hypothetical protein